MTPLTTLAKQFKLSHGQATDALKAAGIQPVFQTNRITLYDHRAEGVLKQLRESIDARKVDPEVQAARKAQRVEAMRKAQAARSAKAAVRSEIIEAARADHKELKAMIAGLGIAVNNLTDAVHELQRMRAREVIQGASEGKLAELLAGGVDG